MENNTANLNQFERPSVDYEVELLDGTKVIFKILKWSPTKVYQRIPKIGKTFAVPLSMIMTATGEEGATINDVIPMALIHFFSTVEEQGVVEFFKLILEDVYFKGQSVNDNFDSLFYSEPEIVLDLVSKVIEVHYAPFFKKGFAKLLNPMGMVASLEQVNSPQA